MIGDLTREPAGAAARRQWIEELGLWYQELAERADWIASVGSPAAQIEAHFDQASWQLARTLHETGVIEHSIGRSVPVIVNELEYYVGIARRTEPANPPGLADEFTAWRSG